MTEHSTTFGNSAQLKRKATHGLVLETEQQGWMNGVSSIVSPEAEAIQLPRKRRHADDIRSVGNNRLCSKDLLYGKKTLNKVTSTENSNAPCPLNSRKRKSKDTWPTGKVSTSEEALLHVSSELGMEALTTKRLRIDQAEQSTAPSEEVGQPIDHVAAVDFDSDKEQEQELPKYTIIPLPLSLRAQAYLQCQPQQRHVGGQSEASTQQQPLPSCGGSSSALILYNPDIHKRIESTDDCGAASSVSCVTCQSPESTSSMDVD
ncbi:hypothetical protein FBU31_001215 [Coemansia sp. 'formosensis']|nr:hypothetical protein FBU31_001215 [Coemansia sp. 'formosensis']